METQTSDTSGQKRPFFGKRSFGLYFGIFTSIAMLLIMTVVIIVGYIWIQYTNALTEISGNQMNQATAMVREKVVNYLMPAATMAKVSSQLLRDGNFDPRLSVSPSGRLRKSEIMDILIREIKIVREKSYRPESDRSEPEQEKAPPVRSADPDETGLLSVIDKELLDEYGVHLLRAFPQISMANIGDERGNFMMPKKLPDGLIKTKFIDKTAIPEPTVTWIYRDENDVVLRDETDPETDPQDKKSKAYDARTRPWYTGAKKEGGSYWTDVYVFFSDQKPGITTSHPIHDTQGKLTGVFSLDIALGEISAFLKTVKIGKSGIAYIINKKKEMIAYPDPSLIIIKENNKLRPARIDEMEAEWVRSSFYEYRRSNSPRFTFEAEGKRYLGAFGNLGKTFGKEWKIAVVVPEEDFLGPLIHMKRVVPIISIVILLIAVFIARAISRGISNPINALTEETKRIENFDLEGGKPIPNSVIREIQMMTQSISSMKKGLMAFEKYVPSTLVRQLIQAGEEAKLGGKKKELTIFFSDIQGFTSISERVAPETLMVQLFEYNNELTNIIKETNGTIDKYIGDAIMAFWGAPTPIEDHAYQACEAALQCHQKLEELNKKWKEEGKELFITRFGLHSGQTIVGNMGSDERMNYSVLGDSVNLASRVEGINKTYGTKVIITRATLEKVPGHFICRPLDIVAVKGKKKGVMLLELMARANEPLPPDMAELHKLFTKGFQAYTAQKWDEALNIFMTIRRRFPSANEKTPNESSDEATNLYIRRCTEYRDSPPEDGWDGVYRPTKK